jgi:DNA-3-methyladenine glycosylase
MQKLPAEYYLNPEVVFLAKDMLGKFLFTQLDGQITAGIITETEAYEGATDKASHAFGNRFTKRTSTLYEKGGIAYIYLCYGIHHLFNVVTNVQGIPHAVLIRGIKPLEGIGSMLSRMNSKKGSLQQLNGPGKLSKALGITTAVNGISLNSETLWLASNNIKVPEKSIIISPRVGVDYAGEHALWPYRFIWDKPELTLNNKK